MPLTNSNGRNYVYRLRRTRGLGQKQFAALLGYRGTSMVSRMEAGTSVPSLKVGLLMEIVLGARLSEIYIELYEQLQRQALARASKLPPTLSRQIRGRVLRRD
jgi:DNA-binding XRE family transcriptional regulator